MADYAFPDDLLDLQKRFYVLDAECEQLAETGSDEALDARRAERMDVVMALHRHTWFEGREHQDAGAARQALRDRARAETADRK